MHPKKHITESGETTSGADSPNKDGAHPPRFTQFEIAEYVCGWLLGDQGLYTAEEAENAIGNALSQFHCGQDGLVASQLSRARQLNNQHGKVNRGEDDTERTPQQ